MKPNFSGSWTLDATKSRMFDGGSASMLARIDHVDPLLTQTVEVSRASGSVATQTFTFRTDGQEVVQQEGNLRSRAWWNGAELVIESYLKVQGRELYFKDHWELSPDGAVLTMTHRDDALAGQIAVLDRIE